MSVLRELTGLRVRVDEVAFAPHYEAPPERPHPVAYRLTLENDSEETVTIRGRKWVVTDARGGRVVVEGEGILGKTPRLRPGERFSYQSYHAIACDSVAEGALMGLTDSGERVFTRIPLFELKVPL